jgi:penicillin-insensitive murein endopeptidase
VPAAKTARVRRSALLSVALAALPVVLATLPVVLAAPAVLLVTLAACRASAQPASTEVTSVGTPQEGRLEGGGVELPLRGPGYHWETQRGNPRGRFGTPALVAALTRAAASVASEYPGADLAIHDLSLPGGGRIQGHGSHTSGRDADVAYYAMLPSGAAIDPTESVWFLPEGPARGQPPSTAARFDAVRVWSFLHALLRDRSIEVQYVFMEPGLQRLLLAHARRSSHRALVPRLVAVLRVPRGDRVDPHADHMHVRIRCAARDRARGCRDR